MKKLYTFKNGPVFLAHPVYYYSVLHVNNILLYNNDDTNKGASCRSGYFNKTNFCFSWEIRSWSL